MNPILRCVILFVGGWFFLVVLGSVFRSIIANYPDADSERNANDIVNSANDLFKNGLFITILCAASFLIKNKIVSWVAFGICAVDLVFGLVATVSSVILVFVSKKRSAFLSAICASIDFVVLVVMSLIVLSLALGKSII